ISEGNNNQQTLYFGTGDLKSTSLKYNTLPPKAPEGCFDARFSSGKFIEMFPSDTPNQTEYLINIQSTSVPLTIYWNIRDKTTKYIMRDEAGQVYVLDREGSLKFTEQVPVSRTLRLTAESYGIPNEFALQQNYPNPFNPITRIEYELPKTTFVSIKVFNLVGSEIATLVEGEKEAGYHSVDFNTSTSGGLPSGIYIYKMRADKFTSVKKMILMR
ncbi:MAG: T9SS type A sorting domain-containing protein, partial [Ignavibacteriales bacterium]|nr:T9SS type A sorting domain-containing protein [Ignavibacteriales bacterium]